MFLGMRRTLILAALAVVVSAAGCGESSSSTTTKASTAAAANPAEEAQAQRHAESIFEGQGIDYYVGVLRPSTVRFSSQCPPARKEEEGGKEGPAIPGKWHCAGWGLIAIEGGEGKPGECEFVEGEVTASGLVGKPSGNAMSFSSSPCQLNIGLGSQGKKPSRSLVAAWTHKQQTEKQHVQEKEASPSGQEAKHEEAQQESEEAKRTEEAHKAEPRE
jgi:hypothetical protein